ncbi:MAG: hypothetical protein R6V10_08110 [bacterium]
MKADREVFEKSRVDPDLIRLGKPDESFKLLVGGALIIVGIYIALMPADVLPVHGRPLPWFFAVPFGGVMAVLGAMIIGFRQDLMIDRRNRTAVIKSGFVLPYRQAVIPLDDYDRVALEREVIEGKELRYNTVFKVLLDEERGLAEPLQVMAGELADARQGSRELSAFLSLPLEDRLEEGSSGGEGAS